VKTGEIPWAAFRSGAIQAMKRLNARVICHARRGQQTIEKKNRYPPTYEVVGAADEKEIDKPVSVGVQACHPVGDRAEEYRFDYCHRDLEEKSQPRPYAVKVAGCCAYLGKNVGEEVRQRLVVFGIALVVIDRPVRNNTRQRVQRGEGEVGHDREHQS
jgi:hypothetical protein